MSDHATVYAVDPRPLSAAELAAAAPDARVSERREGLLRRPSGSFEVVWPAARVTITSLPADEVPAHLASFCTAMPEMRERLARVRSVFGCVIEGQERGSVDAFVDRLARARGAFVFRPDGIVDHALPVDAVPRGEPVFLVDGVRQDPLPPDAARVARRALVLGLVAGRGLIEKEVAPDGTTNLVERLASRVRRFGLAAELEPDESRLLATPHGEVPRQVTVDAVWRIEGLAVLAWALELAELPGLDELADPPALIERIGLFAEGIPAPRLRPAAEIAVMDRRLLAIHWRLREFGLRPRAMDFLAFAERAPFGPFDPSGLPIVDGDLVIAGASLAHAEPELITRSKSAACERHRAILWLGGQSPRYGSIETDT